MHPRIQFFCALSGPLFVVFFVAGWWFVAGFVAPHAPSMDAETLAASYAANTGRIRFGVLIAMIGSAFVMPFTALISAHLYRIERGFPVLSFTNLLAGALVTLILLTPTVLWTVAAFRPDRPPELILLANDHAWLFFLMTFAPVFMQPLAIALGIMTDGSPQPTFPRWLAYFNVWVAILLVPGGLITFFKHGPFAWDGLLAFWLALAAFVAWFFVMAWALLRAIEPSPS